MSKPSFLRQWLRAIGAFVVIGGASLVAACGGGGGGSAPVVLTSASPVPSASNPSQGPVASPLPSGNPSRSPIASPTASPTPLPSPTPIPVLTAPQFRFYPLRGAYPYAIVTPPDGNLWLTEAYSSQIAKLSTSGQIASYDLVPGASTNSVEPQGLVVAPDGSLWLTERNAFAIAHVTTDGVVRAQLPIGAPNGPDWIAYGSDGNLWFTQDPVQSVVGRMTPGGQYTGFVVQQAVYEIAAAGDGNLWLGAGSGVIRLTTAGVPTVYPAPSTGGNQLAQIQSVCAGSDGNIWAGGWAGGATGLQAYALKIAPDGTYSAYLAPGPPATNTSAMGIAKIGCAGSHIFLAASVNLQTGPTILTEFTLGGSVVQARQVPPTGGGTPAVNSMTLGPDGGLWFTDTTNQTVDVWEFQ